MLAARRGSASGRAGWPATALFRIQRARRSSLRDLDRRLAYFLYELGSEQLGLITHASGWLRAAQPIGASCPWKGRTTRSRVISSDGWLSRKPPRAPRSERTMPAVRRVGMTCSSAEVGTPVRRGRAARLIYAASSASASASTPRRSDLAGRPRRTDGALLFGGAGLAAKTL